MHVLLQNWCGQHGKNWSRMYDQARLCSPESTERYLLTSALMPRAYPGATMQTSAHPSHDCTNQQTMLGLPAFCRFTCCSSCLSTIVSGCGHLDAPLSSSL